MKLPRDLSGRDLAKRLERLGTLATVLDLVAEHFGIERIALVERLFGKR